MSDLMSTTRIRGDVYMRDHDGERLERMRIGTGIDFADRAEAERWARQIINEAAEDGHAWAVLTEEVYYAPANIWEPYVNCIIDDDNPLLATWEG